MKRYFAALLVVATSASPSVAAQDGVSFLLGGPAPMSALQRTIAIDANTRWVNVNNDEVVNFSADGTTFAWRFAALGSRPFDLREVAPANTLSQAVTVYVLRGQQW